VVNRQWTHWATSKDLVGLKLPAHDAGTGLTGRALGDAQRGAPFVFDPFDAYAAGLVSNPNMIVAGSIGAGKSTVVKMVLDRALERGRRVVVIDPKGEYAFLARRHDVEVLTRPRRLVQSLRTERPGESRSPACADRECPRWFAQK
jgi:hypothetical protein